jgi:hypothetical protein
MASLLEILRALYGVWRLAHLDRRAFACFDLSAEGALRSFTAAAIVAPFYAVLTALRFDDLTGIVTPGHYVFVEAITYVISWVLYPVIVEALTRAVGCRDRFPAYLCVYNWTMILQNGIVIGLAMLGQLEIFSGDVLGFLGLVTLALTAGLLWYLARTALGVPPSTAVGFVILDILISVLVNGIADALL